MARLSPQQAAYYGLPAGSILPPEGFVIPPIGAPPASVPWTPTPAAAGAISIQMLLIIGLAVYLIFFKNRK